MWQNYNPVLPIFEIQATKLADVSGSYFDYRCVNFYSAEWGDSYPLPGYEIPEEVELDEETDEEDDGPTHF